MAELEEKGQQIAAFQRKLTITFCQEVWRALQQWVLRRLGGEQDNDIDCEAFLKVMTSTGKLEAHEFVFVRQIFDHVHRGVDRGVRGCVATADLAVALALLGSRCSRYEKAWFLFKVFDSDSDGCLTCEQILRLYCCAVIHGSLARNDKQMYRADIALGDELSLARARRLYEFTSTMLPRSQEGFYSFQEWWAVLERHEVLLEELLPNCSRILWLLEPPRKLNALPPSVPGLPRHGRRATRRISCVARPRHSAPVEAASALSTAAGAVVRSSASAASPVSAAETFRMQAAIRFRHAVRGEWDRVDALRGELRRGAPEEEAARSSAAWINSMADWRGRQRHANWSRCHGATLTNWSRAAFSAEQGATSATRMAGSRSLPEISPQGRSLQLRSPASSRLGGITSSSSAEELRERTEELLAEISAETRTTLDSMPSKTEYFGHKSLDRVRCLLAAGSNVYEPEGKTAQQLPYKCRLCGGWHDGGSLCSLSAPVQEARYERDT